MFGTDNSQEIGNVGNDSTVNQATGNITINNYGLKISDVIPLVHELVKSELDIYKKQAEETAVKRLNDFSEALEKSITEKVSDKIERFNDPAIQMAARKAALGYIKTGDSLNRENLIDMLIERVKTKENISKQYIIDEAIEILPKLSRECLAVVTLLTFSQLFLSGDRNNINNWFGGFGEVLDIIPYVKPLDLAYLTQVDCVTNHGSFYSRGNWLSILKKDFDIYFRKPVSKENAKPFIDKYEIVSENANCVRLNRIKNSPLSFWGLLPLFTLNRDGSLTLNGSNKTWFMDILNRTGHNYMKDDVEALINKAVSFKEDEIRQHLQKLHHNWPSAIDLLNSNPLDTYSLQPVGVYIGTRQLCKIYKREVSLDLFYH